MKIKKSTLFDFFSSPNLTLLYVRIRSGCRKMLEGYLVRLVSNRLYSIRSRKLPVGSVHRYDLCVHDLIHGKYRPCLIMGSLIMYRDRTYIYILYRYDLCQVRSPAPRKLPVHACTSETPLCPVSRDHGNYRSCRDIGVIGHTRDRTWYDLWPYSSD